MKFTLRLMTKLTEDGTVPFYENIDNYFNHISSFDDLMFPYLGVTLNELIESYDNGTKNVLIPIANNQAEGICNELNIQYLDTFTENHKSWIEVNR